MHVQTCRDALAVTRQLIRHVSDRAEQVMEQSALMAHSRGARFGPLNLCEFRDSIVVDLIANISLLLLGERLSAQATILKRAPQLMEAVLARCQEICDAGNHLGLLEASKEAETVMDRIMLGKMSLEPCEDASAPAFECDIKTFEESLQKLVRLNCRPGRGRGKSLAFLCALAAPLIARAVWQNSNERRRSPAMWRNLTRVV